MRETKCHAANPALLPLLFVAVFKPQDEEPGAVFNPRGHSGSSDAPGSALRRGVRPGEGALREVAAFLLDRGHFAGVPPTALVSCQPQALAAAVAAEGGVPDAAPSPSPKPAVGVKVGSLQQFVHADSDCEDRGPAPFPVQEVRPVPTLFPVLWSISCWLATALSVKTSLTLLGGSQSIKPSKLLQSYISRRAT